MGQWLYLSPELDAGAEFDENRLRDSTERHKIALQPGTLMPLSHAPEQAASRNGLDGVVISLAHGCASRVHLRLTRRLLNAGRRVWFYWPSEEAVECVDDERLASYWRHWAVVQTFRQFKRLRLASEAASFDFASVQRVLRETLERARPVPFERRLTREPSSKIDGIGVYLRTDYWAKIDSGGSYGHTCYVAKELAASTSEFVAFMAHRYGLLDSWGVRQIVLDSPSASAAETDLIAATDHYYSRLRPALEAMTPRYIYERVCLGNFAGARLSLDLGIPYIAEYNGSELSMRRSFQGSRYQYEDFFLKAEEAAFRQATLISVVSEAVKEEIVRRGVDPARVLVNPNGVDPEAYAPPSPDEKRAIRAQLGWSGDERVVAFIGTFGGWHGVDVLAQAMPLVASQVPAARFLLVGDGTHKQLLDDAISAHHLEDRVFRAGRVPQSRGAQLLRAGDVYVSPHSSHMVDSRFFGSPTKLFEYMSLAGGIVASDLEQIGDVLSPALRPAQVTSGVTVTDERAVLCKPGDVTDFATGVVGLLSLPEVAAGLGRNARSAVLNQFSWARHVERLWPVLTGARSVDEEGFASTRAAASQIVPPTLTKIQTGDEYKDQVQNQWNNNPVGSQYVKKADPHTLEWFLEVEAHRYGEYGPWMPDTMEFARHRGDQVLEIGGGMGTDLAQFAKNGAHVTDVDLSAGHLALAQENFRLRGLQGRFIHQDAETLPFGDHTFDLVYSNGVIHHTPNTRGLVDEIYRVLKPGGRTIIMVYAENSLHYWGVQVGMLGLRGGMLNTSSVGDIMSRSVEMTANDARPLVKVYTKPRLRRLFQRFADVTIVQRQLTAPELPSPMRWIPLSLAGRLVGWNLVLKATKPR